MKRVPARLNPFCRWCRSRRGATMVECVVAAAILIVAMSTVTSMAFRVNRVWIDVAHERFAMNELSNELEELTQLPPGQIDIAIEKLRPSREAEVSLNQPKLTGRAVRDAVGRRIELELSWQATPQVRSVQLSGWIDLTEATP